MTQTFWGENAKGSFLVEIAMCRRVKRPAPLPHALPSWVGSEMLTSGFGVEEGDDRALRGRTSALKNR